MKNKKERTKCEVYTRCVGYLRKVDSFNDGKFQEYKDRKIFEIPK